MTKTEQKFEYKPENVSIVPVESIVESGYNPKEQRTADWERVRRSIELNGLMAPIIVRNDPENNKQYIAVDGHQRLEAAKDLGYKEIPIYNLGSVSEERAKALTIWLQRSRVEFDQVDLSHLVAELSNLEVELPYTDVEIQDFKGMAGFNFDEYDNERPEDDFDMDTKTFKVVLGAEAYEIVDRAIKQIMEDNDCSESRALELLAADYLAGA